MFYFFLFGDKLHTKLVLPTIRVAAGVAAGVARALSGGAAATLWTHRCQYAVSQYEQQFKNIRQRKQKLAFTFPDLVSGV